MNINEKIHKISDIVNYLKVLDIVDENVKVDPNAIAINATIFNNLLYDIYQYSSYKSAKEIAKGINKKYKTKLDEKDVRNIIENEYFMDFMKMMYKKHSKLINEIQEVQDGEHPACKLEGGSNEQPLDRLNYRDNLLGEVFNALEDKDFVEKEDVKEVINKIPLFKAYSGKDWDYVAKMISNWIINMDMGGYIDILFFPLYYLEKSETFGKYNSIIIDLIGLWINLVDIILKFTTPIFLKGLTTLVTVASTIPALNVGTAPLATILGLIEGPLSAFITSLPMFFKFLMSLQRKDFKRALDYMSRIFPSLGVAMISATNILTTINKFLLLLEDNSEFVYKNVSKFMNLIPTDLNNLMSFDFDTGYKKFIKPNISDTPLVKGIVNFTGLDKTMDNFNRKRKRLLDKYNEEQMKVMGKVTRDLIDKQNEIKEKI
jgi:hypothetical protein